MKKQQKTHNKVKMITLNNNDNSNKNININISYNLTQPKTKTQIINQTSNGSISNKQTNNTETSFIKCKKIENKDRIIEQDQQKYSYQSSLRKKFVEQINESMENECEISIKLVNKKMSLGNKMFKELIIKPKKIIKNEKRTFNVSNMLKKLSREASPNYDEFQPVYHDKNKREKSRSQSMIKCKSIQNKNKTMKINQQLFKDMQKSSKKLKKQTKKVEKHKTQVTQKKIKFKKEIIKEKSIEKKPTIKLPKKQQKSKEFFFKKNKKEKIQTQIQPQIIQKMLKMSQLNSSIHKSSIPSYEQTIDITPIIKNQQQIQKQLKNNAAIIIQRYWRQRKKTKVLKYYEQIFKKNAFPTQRSSETPQLLPSFENILREELQKQQSQQFQKQSIQKANQKDFFIKNSKFNNFQYQIIQPVLDFDNLKHRNTSSGNVEEQDSQFNINKYQQMIQNSINQQSPMLNYTENSEELGHKIKRKQVQKVDNYTNPEIQILKFKEYQIKQWNYIQQFIQNQLENEFNIEPEQLLKQIIYQSQENKRWIEKNCLKNQNQDVNYLKLEEKCKNSSKSSLKSQNYKSLIQQKGISDKAFKQNYQVRKLIIEDEEKLAKRKKLHKSSLSESDLEDQYYKNFKTELKQAYETKNQLQKQELNDSIQQNKQQIKVQTIENYLNCGFDKLDTVNKQIKSNDFDQTKRNLCQILSDLRFKKSSKQQDYELLNDNKIANRYRLNSPRLQDSKSQDKFIQNVKMSRIQQNSQIFQKIYEKQILELCKQLIKKQTIYNKLKHFQRYSILKKRNIKIKTNLQSIKQFLNKFIQFILSNQNFKKQTIRNINCILGPTSREMLYYLRAQNYSHCQSFIQDQAFLFVASLHIFQSFLEFQYANQNKVFDTRTKAITHYWYRAIFEAFNEALDQERPFGIFGKPYQWQIMHRIHHQKITETSIGYHLVAAMNRIFQIANCPSGIIFDKQDCPYFNYDLSEEQKNKINTDRIFLMLSEELLECEKTNTNYNDEITEIMMDLSVIMIQKLMYEASVQLRNINQNRMINNLIK